MKIELLTKSIAHGMAKEGVFKSNKGSVIRIMKSMTDGEMAAFAGSRYHMNNVWVVIMNEGKSLSHVDEFKRLEDSTEEISTVPSISESEYKAQSWDRLKERLDRTVTDMMNFEEVAEQGEYDDIDAVTRQVIEHILTIMKELEEGASIETNVHIK